MLNEEQKSEFQKSFEDFIINKNIEEYIALLKIDESLFITSNYNKTNPVPDNIIYLLAQTFMEKFGANFVNILMDNFLSIINQQLISTLIEGDNNNKINEEFNDLIKSVTYN